MTVVWLPVTDFIDSLKKGCVLRCQFSPKKQSLHLVQMNAHNILFILLLNSVVLWAVHLMVYITEKEFHSWASQYFLNNIFTATLTLRKNNITLSTNNNVLNFFCTSYAACLVNVSRQILCGASDSKKIKAQKYSNNWLKLGKKEVSLKVFRKKNCHYKFLFLKIFLILFEYFYLYVVMEKSNLFWCSKVLRYSQWNSQFF